MRIDAGTGEFYCGGCGLRKKGEKKPAKMPERTELQPSTAKDTELPEISHDSPTVSKPKAKETTPPEESLPNLNDLEPSEKEIIQAEATEFKQASEPEPPPPPPPSPKPKAPAVEPPAAQPKSKGTSPTRKKKRAAQAQRLTELRRLSRDITARVNDIEIQVDRRLEEIQNLLIQLDQAIEAYED